MALSEFMAINERAYADASPNYPDWIEIRNTTVFPPSSFVSLEGWYLTDDPGRLTKWRFPATNLYANGYLAAQVQDASVASGGIALVASAQGTDANFLFDNLKVINLVAP